MTLALFPSGYGAPPNCWPNIASYPPIPMLECIVVMLVWFAQLGRPAFYETDGSYCKSEERRIIYRSAVTILKLSCTQSPQSGGNRWSSIFRNKDPHFPTSDSGTNKTKDQRHHDSRYELGSSHGKRHRARPISEWPQVHAWRRGLDGRAQLFG